MKIDCPHCGVHGFVDDSQAGAKLRCPECTKIFLVSDDMLPDAEDANLVHQEILDDSVPIIPPAAITEQETEDERDTVEEVAADEEPEISNEELFGSMPVMVDEDEDLALDVSEMSNCSVCGQPFAPAFLVEIDSKLYCALCEPDTEAEGDDEESLAFEGHVNEDQGNTEDDDVLAFAGDGDDLDDIEAALTPEDLELCAGCGESLHPQFLDSFEGEQYCALCFPKNNEDNLQLSEDVELEEEEGDVLDSASALMFDNDEDDTGVDEEESVREACFTCGEKFHKDFLQEIDSKLYCGVCQPEVVETMSSGAATELDTGAAVISTKGEEYSGEVQDSGADFTVGGTIKEAWQKTKGAKGAIWAGILVMYLILFGISFVGFYGTESMVESNPNLALGINGGLQLVTSWLSMLMTGGLMLIGVRHVLEQRVSWKMVFVAFSGKNIIAMTIATVLQILLIGIGFLLLVLPGIYLTVGYALTLPLILDKGLGPWEALETSRKAIHKKWWKVLGVYLVMMLLYMVSMIPLGLGLIWTVPMFMVLVGVLYGRLFGYHGTEDVEEDNEKEIKDEEEDVVNELAEESEESL